MSFFVGSREFLILHPFFEWSSPHIRKKQKYRILSPVGKAWNSQEMSEKKIKRERNPCG